MILVLLILSQNFYMHRTTFAIFNFSFPPLLLSHPLSSHPPTHPPLTPPSDLCDPLDGGGQRSTGGAWIIGLRNAQRALVRAALQRHSSIISLLSVVEPAASVFGPIELGHLL